MKPTETHIFSAQKAHTLDNKIIKILQNPYKIISPFVNKGMTVVDYGCGNVTQSLTPSEILAYIDDNYGSE